MSLKEYLQSKSQSVSRNPVEIAGYDGKAFMREFSVAESETILMMLNGSRDGSATAHIVVYGVVDENGNRVFDDGDIPMIEDLRCAGILDDVIAKGMAYITGDNTDPKPVSTETVV